MATVFRRLAGDARALSTVKREDSEFLEGNELTRKRLIAAFPDASGDINRAFDAVASDEGKSLLPMVPLYAKMISDYWDNN